MNKGDLIDADEYLAANTFDTALPQEWVDDVYAKTGVYPAPIFVWVYDQQARYWGRPYPLTDEARALLARYEEVNR